MQEQYNNNNKGVAFKNDYKTSDKHPTYKGKGNFNGLDFEFGIWIKESDKGKFLTFSFSEPYVRQDMEERGDDSAKHEVVLDDDEPIDLNSIPF